MSDRAASLFLLSLALAGCAQHPAPGVDSVADTGPTGPNFSSGICLCTRAHAARACPDAASVEPRVTRILERRRGADCLVSVDAFEGFFPREDSMYDCNVCCYALTVRNTPECQPPPDTAR